jgi:hypothetical protein
MSQLPDVPHEVSGLLKLIDSNPRDAASWQALGDQLSAMGNHRQAAACYERALSFKPTDAQAQALYQAAHREREQETDLHTVPVNLKPLLGFQLPLWFQVFLALYSFVATLFLALANQWQPTELVWGFWISSLVTGYAMLLTSIVGSFFQPENGPQNLGTQMFTAFPLFKVLGALFMLAFFSIHFGFFHLVIGIFLGFFFPLAREGMMMDNPFSAMQETFWLALRQFWPIIALSFLTQIRAFRHAWYTPVGKAMGMPYGNVVRMHLSIFAFAFLSMLAGPQVLIYVVLFFYFFPWGQVLGFLFGKQKVAARPE